MKDKRKSIILCVLLLVLIIIPFTILTIEPSSKQQTTEHKTKVKSVTNYTRETARSGLFSSTSETVLQSKVILDNGLSFTTSGVAEYYPGQLLTVNIESGSVTIKVCDQFGRCKWWY